MASGSWDVTLVPHAFTRRSWLASQSSRSRFSRRFRRPGGLGGVASSMGGSGFVLGGPRHVRPRVAVVVRCSMQRATAARYTRSSTPSCRLTVSSSVAPTSTLRQRSSRRPGAVGLA